MKNADSKPPVDARRGEPSGSPVGRVSLVGAGPGDPDLWTVRAARLVREADLVLYDALVDAVALRGLTNAPCFHVGKRAGRHALTRGDRRHALQRERHRQHGYGEKAKQGSKHCLNSMSVDYGAGGARLPSGRRMSAPQTGKLAEREGFEPSIPV